jgi:hypothetical protein
MTVLKLQKLITLVHSQILQYFLTEVFHRWMMQVLQNYLLGQYYIEEQLHLLVREIFCKMNYNFTSIICLLQPDSNVMQPLHILEDRL